MNLLKKIAIFASFNMFVFSGIACSKDKADVKIEANASIAADSKSNSVEAPRVYTLSDVQTPEKNKFADFTFTENGKQVKFSELTKGKVVFLNFWGTWCPPCKRELPDIVQIYNELKGKDFIVIGVALERDASTALSIVTNFAKEKGLYYHMFVDNDRKLQAAYGGISAVPTTFIIDKSGNIVETIVGGRNKEAFMQSLNKVL